MQKLIDNCAALKLDPDLIDRSYVYTADREYSQIWTKEDVHDDEPIYYYYRIQIVGLRHDGYDQEGSYLFVQNWGAFDTINHRKRSDYLPLRQCLQKFVIQSADRSRNSIFAKIKENDISKYPLPEPVQELIAKNIFDINFLKKMISEYTIDVQNTICAFLGEPNQLKAIKTYSLNEYSYAGTRELLDKTISCEPTDKNEGKNRIFSLMNFYYKQLHTTIKILDKHSERYNIIEKYFCNSQSYKHTKIRLELENVFEIERPCDNHIYTKDLKNKQLLWHGTRKDNVPSLLYEGFRTTKARSCGMFGAGIYFANSVSKAFQYGRPVTVLLLCEVALGDIMERSKSCTEPLNADGELPDGKNSVHGVGSITPDVNDSAVIDDSVLVPYGKFGEHGQQNVVALVHDEFIVYNSAQIKMRYLVTTHC